jgi:hypothetical protein
LGPNLTFNFQLEGSQNFCSLSMCRHQEKLEKHCSTSVFLKQGVATQILQNFHLNIKFMVFCFKKVSPKNNFMKNVSPTKKGWEPLLYILPSKEIVGGPRACSNDLIKVLASTDFHWRKKYFCAKVHGGGQNIPSTGVTTFFPKRAVQNSAKF